MLRILDPFGIIREGIWLARAGKRAAESMRAGLSDCEPW